MDSLKRESLVNSILELGFSNNGSKTIAVTLDEFFEGNDDIGSLACNLDPHPGMESFYYYLTRFANDNEVEVYVEIYEMDEDDDEIWPYSERVYLIGDIERDAIEGLLADVLASEIEDLGDIEINGQVFSNVYALWWD